ncbi:Flavonoid 3'-monooxygenase [Camellia lanceoleosa]|uniref:Flavonoid 3'-monooxygenase n=1 Tax=Camellia lanceoleosa TaxID=1840588 RepID=A0ACC0G4P9_9ERIC|nr:Flavonoid 3'-monooxygenase [Camellia lanceoleosa]
MLSDLLNNLSTTVLQQWAPWLSQLSNNKNEFAGAILTLSILILPLFWYLRTFTNSRNQTTEAPLPPGPRGLPVLGYLPFLGTNLHHSFSHLAHHYGPVFKLWLGNKLYVVITSPSLAKQVVRDQDIVFSNRDPPISALAATYGAQDIAWSSYGSHWRNMRKIFVREMLSNSSLEACYNLRRTEVRKTITQVYRKICKPVEIGEIAFLTEFNVVLSMLWGSTFDIQEKVNSRVGAKFRAATAKMMVLLGKPNLSDFFPGLARFDLQGVEREMKEIVVDVERVFDSVIDARVKMEAVNDGGKKDFLQILLELKGEGGATPITKTQIKALLMDIILKEDHPLAFNMSFAISLGLFPVKLSLETTGCGIKKSGLRLKRLEIWRMALFPGSRTLQTALFPTCSTCLGCYIRWIHIVHIKRVWLSLSLRQPKDFCFCTVQR